MNKVENLSSMATLIDYASDHMDKDSLQNLIHEWNKYENMYLESYSLKRMLHSTHVEYVFYFLDFFDSENEKENYFRLLDLVKCIIDNTHLYQRMEQVNSIYYQYLDDDTEYINIQTPDNYIIITAQISI